MEILNFSPEQFKAFILILIRVSVVLYMFPVFGSTMFPNLAKAGLALAFSMVLFPVVQINLQFFPENIVEFMMLMVSEFFIGMVLGLSVRMFFAAVEVAGQMIGFQMGFAVINVFDPQTGSQVSIVDQIGYLVIVLVFLSLNGHHALINALTESFQIVDIGLFSLKEGLFEQIISISAQMFVLAVKIGAPAIIALLFTSTAFGICAKFAPQMNVLIAAFPIKIVVGLLFLGLFFQLSAALTRSYMVGLKPLLRSLLVLMGGG